MPFQGFRERMIAMMKPRHLALAAAITLISGVGVSQAQTPPVEQQIIDAMNKAFGVHPGFRANHAKGIVVEGHFKATPEAANYSKAVIFNGSTIPVTVRFSDATGVPNIADGSSHASPHGIAIKYHLPGGGETDMVLNSRNFAIFFLQPWRARPMRRSRRNSKPS
jgi:catalase